MAKTDDLPEMTGDGVAPKKIKKLDNAIEAWRGFVEKRMELTESEVAARDKCIFIMHAEGLTKYPYWVSDDEQKLLVLESNEKLKLKNAVFDDGETADDTDVDN